MLSNFAQLISALTLLLAAHASPSSWTRPLAGEVEAKCTAASHQQGASWQGKPATRLVIVQRSTSSELQILSYGP
ncbi:hypothetical protein LVY65_09250 [Sphingomonas sp. G124]|uniref:Uncharacterized protein n=1 Tax=Sphingomonas cremea TaxID=2904799 RepID=A0A9X1U5J0_9SPHN|nr:hypothetical protein [Sphingomonas cremea]MCF2515246.1 hypothetical protein [Sphingomonas cremea]